MTHDEMIAVIQAHKEGKTIEWRYKRLDVRGGWQIVTLSVWNFEAYEYRVKKEPRVWWMVDVVDRTSGRVIVTKGFVSKEKADAYINHKQIRPSAYFTFTEPYKVIEEM